MKDIIKRLKTYQNRMLINLPERLRPFFKTVKTTNRAIIIIGPRGTGKTTFMLNRIKDNNYFYFSADNPLVSTIPLFDLGEAIFLEGYEGLFIDEIHYAADWGKHLKALYDVFPGKIIWVSDSSTIVLRGGLEDLSRRFVLRKIPLLSLREYIFLKNGEEAPIINAYSDDRKPVYQILKKFPILRYFREYLECGFRPFVLENPFDYQEKIMNTIEKSLSSDIPFLLPQLAPNHFRFMHAVVGHLAISKIPTLSINSMCKKWGIGKEKLYQLLIAMEYAMVIRIIRKKKDRKIHSVGSKLFLYEPTAYSLFESNLGNIRESYVAGISLEANRKVFASDNEEQYDFWIDHYKVEVGGKTKHAKGADFVLRDDVDIPDKNIIPLWMLGFEY